MENNNQDSFTIGTSKEGALKVYFNLEDLETTEKKVKNFFKLKKFIDEYIK